MFYIQVEIFHYFWIITLSTRVNSGLLKDHGQQARASENFAGPVDFETPRPDLPVHCTANDHSPKVKYII